ncbi:hypothetical protein COCSADRAFT_189696 [Bipolaris sorokiniana ND90Pr]|uniref:Uncharacterized protein n=1 Tax=Cochliobolus sativus (strain ND90Pr / ATCC 201652) TaxID=665912 RepID=M2SBG0_COCSN|nr:uncharacterized protein COCSADRAFT_189696 [Bipolaris sorokiniana ND90Pr]EMD64618.1 hypothetical protein COCSADRAFT_189696 [Bipolaris sorokiniana ND90Pr]
MTQKAKRKAWADFGLGLGTVACEERREREVLIGWLGRVLLTRGESKDSVAGRFRAVVFFWGVGVFDWGGEKGCTGGLDTCGGGYYDDSSEVFYYKGMFLVDSRLRLGACGQTRNPQAAFPGVPLTRTVVGHNRQIWGEEAAGRKRQVTDGSLLEAEITKAGCEREAYQEARRNQCWESFKRKRVRDV